MNDFDFEIPDLIGKVLPETNELKILSVIGYGSFAVVYKAADIDGNLFAVKCIVKNGLNAFQLELQYREAELLQSLEDHPNIINLYQVIDTEENLFFVLDLCECDLFEAIVHNHGFDNEYTKEVFEILIDTVQYLHERQIYHRDLKPENILITVDGDIKIADFGLACSDTWSKDFDCGTLRYEPPECVDPASKGYCPEKSDIWALGVILVNLRYERNPWAYASPEDNIYYEFIHNNVNVLQQQLGLSDEMNVVLKNIFKIDPNKRWSLEQVREAILSMDEMYDDSKYNPIPTKKNSQSSPIPITPNSKKAFSYTFSSANSSTYNNSPEFVKHYENGYYDNDEKEYTLQDQTFVNSKYDDYFLNHASFSHFSFCSREDDDDEEDEEFEEEEEDDDEGHPHHVHHQHHHHHHHCHHHHLHPVKPGEEHACKKDKDIKKIRNPKVFCRDLEHETFYLEDDLCSPKDNKLYRSIKKGSICSRCSPSIRNENTSSAGPFENLHRNENKRALHPTPLRINTNLYCVEDESFSKKEALNTKDHVVPESWEDYSDDDSVDNEEIDVIIEHEIVDYQPSQNPPRPFFLTEKEGHQFLSPQECSDKIASFYKAKVIGLPSCHEDDEEEDEEEDDEATKKDDSLTDKPEPKEPVEDPQAKEEEESEITETEDLPSHHAMIPVNSHKSTPNFRLVSSQSSLQKKGEDDDHSKSQWRSKSFFPDPSMLVNLIWMSCHPSNDSSLLKYYIPQFRLYLYLFSYQLMERLRKLPALTSISSTSEEGLGNWYMPSSHVNDPPLELWSTQNKTSVLRPYWNDNKHLKSIVTMPFSFNPNDKENRLIIRSKPYNIFNECRTTNPSSILSILLKILNKILDLNQNSVKPIKSKTKSISTDSPPLSSKEEENNSYEYSILPSKSNHTTVKFNSCELKLTSFELAFLFLLEKLKMTIQMFSFQRISSPLSITTNINNKFINMKMKENFIISIHHLYSKFIYLLLRTSF